MVDWQIGRTIFLSFPLVLPSSQRVKICPFSMYLRMLIKSPRSLLILCVVIPSRLFLFSGLLNWASRSILVILFCTRSILAISPWNIGFHSSMQYSRWGRTYSLNILLKNSGFRDIKHLLIRLISLFAFLHDWSVCWWNLRSCDMMMPRSLHDSLRSSSWSPILYLGWKVLVDDLGLYCNKKHLSAFSLNLQLLHQFTNRSISSCT